MPTPTSDNALPSVCPAEADRAAQLVRELLAHLRFGCIEITVAQGRITAIEQRQKYRLDELEAALSAPEP